MPTSLFVLVFALSAGCGTYYYMTMPRVTVSVESPSSNKVADVAGYLPCDAQGCCDEVPSFCKVSVNAFADSCAYDSISSRCSHSCGKCHSPTEVVEPDSGCIDEWVNCPRLAKATGDLFCELDTHRHKCQKTCGTCGVTCEDSHSHRFMCGRAKKDLRRCAASKTAEQCPETCGVCSKTPLHELLEHQACVDPPQCALSDEEVSNAALAKYRACEDSVGSCRTMLRNNAALCSDPTYRDVLCRNTCKTCTPPPGAAVLALEELFEPTVAPPSPPAKLLWRTQKCSDVKARTCPRLCGVCKPRGSRSVWVVDNAERLIATVETLNKVVPVAPQLRAH